MQRRIPLFTLKTFCLLALEASQLYFAARALLLYLILGRLCTCCFHKRKYHNLKTNKLTEQDCPFVFEGRLQSVGSYRDLSGAAGDDTRCLLQSFYPTNTFDFDLVFYHEHIVRSAVS